MVPSRWPRWALAAALIATEADLIRSVRLAFIAALMAAMALAGAPVASAHAVRIATDPADNAALAHGTPAGQRDLQRAVAARVRRDDRGRSRRESVVVPATRRCRAR